MKEIIDGLIRDIPDFPKPGILFKDITPLLSDPQGLQMAIDAMATPYIGKEVDLVVGVESRGFIFAPMLAYRLNVGFVPVRKPGKLPYRTIEESYELEYGTDTLQMHEDAITKGQNVLIVDDLMATGGTVGAVVNLVRKAGGNVIGASFLIELDFLEGRKKLGDIPVHSLLHY